MSTLWVRAVASKQESERMETNRRSYAGYVELVVPIVGPEDIVVQKLRWYEIGGRVSDRQLADVRSVGVQGDGRTYGHPIVLRPVSSEDAMMTSRDVARAALRTIAVAHERLRLNDALLVFEQKFGPYLWDKVGYAAVPFSSGAMEHATCIAYPVATPNCDLAPPSEAPAEDEPVADYKFKKIKEAFETIPGAEVWGEKHDPEDAAKEASNTATFIIGLFVAMLAAVPLAGLTAYLAARHERFAAAVAEDLRRGG